MNRAIAIARAMRVEGSHLHHCFADPGIRAEGWRLMQRAKRILRRLGWKGVL